MEKKTEIKEIKWDIEVETNSYAGNFERKLVAYCTGVIGECGVGSTASYEEEEEYNFESILRQEPDDHGCYHPVSIGGKGCKTVIIHFDIRPTDEEIEIIKRRSIVFGRSKKIKILKCNLIQTTIITEANIVTEII